MPTTFQRLHAAVEPESQPLTRIPGRLTSSTVRSTLMQCGIELPPENELRAILASGQTLADSDINKIDAALSAAALPIAERLRFKYALSQQGLLPRGKPVQWLHPAPVPANFPKR